MKDRNQNIQEEQRQWYIKKKTKEKEKQKQPKVTTRIFYEIMTADYIKGMFKRQKGDLGN